MIADTEVRLIANRDEFAHAVQMGTAWMEWHAQTYARGFYERLGYVSFGDEYSDAGIAYLHAEADEIVPADASKAEHGRVVPAWNYLTAHIYGQSMVHDDPEWVGALVRRLTDHHEGAREQRWSVDDAPAAYIAGQPRAIVGVEVLINRTEAKHKVSQNRPGADIDGVIAGLGREPGGGIPCAVASTGCLRLRDLASAGELTLRVADVPSADQAARAHRRLAEGAVRARLVLDFTAPSRGRWSNSAASDTGRP